MKKVCMGVFTLAALAMSSVAEAQYGRLPLSLEVRGHAAFPVGDLADGALGNLKTGFGGGADLTVHVSPVFGIYGGVSGTEFETNDIIGTTIQEYGFDLGGKLMFPTMTGVSPFLRGGAVFHQVKRNTTGVRPNYDEKVGFEVGGGLAAPLGAVISVTPSVRYVNFGLGTDDTNFSYVAAGLGLMFRF
jgi:opacity protein-like surface antigen